MNTSIVATRISQWPTRHPVVFVVLAALAWWVGYRMLVPASEALVAALPLDAHSHLGRSLQFFFYDTPKVLLLLTGVVFVMGTDEQEQNGVTTPSADASTLATPGARPASSARVRSGVK